MKGKKKDAGTWLKQWKPTPGSANESAELYFDFIIQCSDWSIYTPELSNYLQRYTMLSKFHIQSYGVVYDDLPNKWIEVLNVIDYEVANAMNKRKELSND